jgi:polysaccharide biosynthesis transport protein
MKKFVVKEPQDLFLMLYRRKWWILLTVLPLGVAAVLVALLLPNVYVSETLILIEPRDVPSDVVKEFITGDTQERLAAIQQSALSRTNLLRLLNEFPGGFSELRRLSEAAAIDRLRGRIDIQVTTSRRARDTVVPYFRISYQDRDPALAQRVTERLATFFIEQDARTREAQVFGTADFLQSELEKVGRDLEAEESHLAQLKERFRYELPEQLDANLRTLDRLQEQLKAGNEQLDRYLSIKYDLERRLSETSPAITREELRRQSVQRTAEVSPLVREYRQGEVQLAELTSRYTDRHPDVVQLRSRLERLRDQIPPEDLLETTPLEGGTGTSVVSEPNPAYQQLSSQLAQVNTELRILEERRSTIEGEIRAYTRRIENTPQREQDIAVHQRRYEALQSRYRDLEVKLTDARLAGSLESRQKGEQFQVVDPASFPMHPAKPNRLIVLLAGLGIALAGGVVLGIAVDFVDQKIWSATEVTELLGVPVVGEISEILSDDELQRQNRFAWARIGGYAALLAVAAVTVYLVQTSPRVRLLGTETLARLLGW